MQWIRFEHQGQECMGQLNDQLVQITDATWADVLAGQSGNITGDRLNAHLFSQNLQHPFVALATRSLGLMG